MVPFDKLKDPEGITFWPRHKGRDGARTPMPWSADTPFAGFSSAEPWLPIDPRHPPLAVDAQEADPGSALAFTRAFLSWRKGHEALITGDIRFLDAPEPVLAFARGSGDGAILCAFNLGRAGAAAWTVPADLVAEPIAGHGLAGTFDCSTIHLPDHGGLFARLHASPG